MADAADVGIAHCNREAFEALIGTSYPGIVISDRWNGYSHLEATRRQVCWSHLRRDFRRHADGLRVRWIRLASARERGFDVAELALE
jgi:Transposase IS66 family